MKVILLDYVYKHGVAGEVIDVADGFARNFLIPRRLAVKATEGEMRRAASLRDQAAARRAALDNRLNDLAREINGVELVFGRRAAPTGKLFGSVTTQEIADALFAKAGVDINRRRISQQGLREIGIHDVPVRLGNEISPVLRVVVVREEELPQYLASQAAAAAPAEEAPAATPLEAVQGAAETVVEAAKDAVEAVVDTAKNVVETVADAATNLVERVTGGSDEDAENKPAE